MVITYSFNNHGNNLKIRMIKYLKNLIFGEPKNTVSTGYNCSCKSEIFYNKDKLIKHPNNIFDTAGFCKECDKKYSVMIVKGEVSVY